MIGVICPSYGQECGVAEYTKNLFSHISDSIVVTKVDQLPANIDCLVIQHENTLWDDQELCSVIRRSTVPVQVTVHTIQPEPRPWDVLADQYISLTSYGVELLKQRNIKARFMPIGCEVPPEVGPAKGMTVGAFGFFEEHKRYFDIAGAVVRLPGTDMKLYSYNRTNNPLYDTFDRSVQNHPIVAYRAFQEQSDLLWKLSHECDLLVFWYRQLSHASASAAVRMGLASGRPVIASQTSWFADLGDAVYRPQSLYLGIEDMLTRPDLYKHYQDTARKYCLENSWENIAKKHVEIFSRLQEK